MSKRWHMRRMGFINFWLYDEEIFSFADGKLFLRGANASGKSITTQSFIPFILDGNRSPERLDPFGSKDRKMEYYFLGNGEKDDVTGYLFLEFKKGNTGQYRTIGIGQRAQKGKPMGFWGFIILDGKRVGDDFNLYKKVGSKKIPYSKQDLRKVLGEDNIVVDSQREYMELVNKYIFCFPRIEQYEQFIQLMIKVRAPKLSRDFKPTKVYEVLNESLQTLSDEDLRAMVDAMEKMDDIQVRLDSLKSSFKDLQSIRAEYDRYNRYMLSKKAQEYINAKEKADNSRDMLDNLKSEVTISQKEINEKEYEKENLLFDIEVLEKEKKVLDAADLESSIETLNNKQSRNDVLRKEKVDFEVNINNRRSKIREYDIKLKEYNNTVEYYQYEIKNMLQDLEDLNEILQFDQHTSVKNAINQQNVRAEFIRIRNNLKDYAFAIEKGLKALQKAVEIEGIWNQKEEELSKVNLNKKNFEDQLKVAENLETECRDKIVEGFYIISDNFKELVITKLQLNLIISCVKKYGGAKDLGAIKTIIDGIYNSKYSTLLKTQIENKKEREELFKKYEINIEQLGKLRTTKDPIPERKDKVIKARRILFEKGITCLPFYETVEFNDKLTEVERPLLEEQLSDLGMMDALVIAKKDYEKASIELVELSDTLLRPNENISTGFNKLIPGKLEPEILNSVKQILDNISEECIDNNVLVVRSDGYFKNGIIEGHSISERQAAFVGAIARKKRMHQLIEEKEIECKTLEERLHNNDSMLEGIEVSFKILKGEYKEIPGFVDLDQAISLIVEANYSLDKACGEYQKKEKELASIIIQKEASEQNVIESCKRLPIKRNVDDYQEVSYCIQDYKDKLIEIESEIGYLTTAELSNKNIQELLEKEEEAIDGIDLQLKKVNQAINMCQAEISQIQQFLNSPENKKRAENLAKIKVDIEQKKDRINTFDKDIAVLESQITTKINKIGELGTAIIDDIDKENKVTIYYREELDLGLVMKRGSRSASECSTEAIASIRENDKNKSVGDIVSSLHKSFQQHSSNLISYGTTLEDCFEDDLENVNLLRKRHCLISTWQGKKLYLEEFYQVLKESIESTELLIQDKDRELFENILADTLSRKLSNRIAESKIWIKNMSDLMLDMDTSMGLTFSLDWKPCTADNDKEIDTQELEKLLRRDRELLTVGDIEKVSAHFRSKIKLSKQMAEDSGSLINYSDLIRDALDYRKWFEFKMYFYRNNDSKKELTNSAFNKFSGGEKAMAMYVPLFSAVNAQYKKSENLDHPRIIALDEAFAGVDDKNISSMFKLVQDLDFDYIMNSQSLWGCYETVRSLRIAELLRPANSSVVTVIYYYWNGKERILDE